MKVLFVCSGNSKFGISPFIKSQGDSLVKKGVDVEYFTIVGKGVRGYLENIRDLRKKLKKTKYDIVHSHYSFSSYVVSLAGAKNQVVSLMGSDVNSGFFEKILIKFFNKIFWKVCIVKSKDMKRKVGIKDAIIIPNGVDMVKFRSIEKNEACKKVGFDPSKRHVVFAASPERIEKNFKLAKSAVKSIYDKNVKLQIVSDVNHELMPYYFSASDMLILTSVYEGSPNVIKEAMACNCPIVSTNVGDVKWIMGNTKGCYLISFNPANVADKIKLALEYSEKYGRTKGRERIKKLKLDSESVANSLVKIYREIINK